MRNVHRFLGASAVAMASLSAADTAAGAAEPHGDAPTAVAAAPPSTLADPCGFFLGGWFGTSPYYNHCGPGDIHIRMDLVGRPDYTICVGPGTTYLGWYGFGARVRFAWYVGPC